MSWTIERRRRVAVVTMTTNPVNAQNQAFFADLHDAFDRLERDHPDSPVVLTGTGRRFSAGLDLDEHFRLFAGDPAAVGSWFAGYRATNMRLFTYPRPTVAAINGHAFAGGLITAAVCDHRIAVTGEASFGLNEVPIGIPMPAVYVRMLSYAWGEPVAARTSLLGEIFTPVQAHALGMVRELVPATDLLDRAVAIAERTPEDCLEQYAFTKRACQAAALRDIADLADLLDTELPEWMTSEHARHAHRRSWQQLKGRPGRLVTRIRPRGNLRPGQESTWRMTRTARRPGGAGSSGRSPTPTCSCCPAGIRPWSTAASVRDAGELLAGVLQLVGPLAGPAEGAGGLAAHVGGRGTAGEVDVLAPVHPPRVGAAGVAREVPGQLPEEPVHDLCPPAVPP